MVFANVPWRLSGTKLKNDDEKARRESITHCTIVAHPSSLTDTPADAPSMLHCLTRPRENFLPVFNSLRASRFRALSHFLTLINSYGILTSSLLTSIA